MLYNRGEKNQSFPRGLTSLILIHDTLDFDIWRDTRDIGWIFSEHRHELTLSTCCCMRLHQLRSVFYNALACLESEAIIRWHLFEFMTI
jgi:hypothetical protein